MNTQKLVTLVISPLFISATIALSTIFAGSTLAQAAPESFQSAALCGKPAPAFSLVDSNGRSHKLADYKGKYVVLEWFNLGCPFVRKHYDSGNMQKLQKDYTAKRVIWLSICSSHPGKQGYHSGQEHNAMFADQHAAPTAILMDEDGTVGRLYGAKTTPDMYIVDPKGVLIYAGAIDDKPDTDTSSIAGSVNYVKKALDQALAGKQIKVATTQSYGCSVKY